MDDAAAKNPHTPVVGESSEGNRGNAGHVPDCNRTLGDTALEYAERRLPVYPVQARNKIPFRGTHGRNDATTDAEQIRRWWALWPSANIGMVTGRESGRVVLDVDRRAGLSELEAIYGELPRTLTVKSGRPEGGLHLHFTHPGGEVKSRPVTDGVEVKGEGGQIIMPPSVHQSGNTYEVVDDSDLATLPMNWQYLLQASDPVAPEAERGSVKEGHRNEYLTSKAGRLRREGESEATIYAYLDALNHEHCDPPLPEREVRSIAKSMMRYEPASPDALAGTGGRHHREIPGSWSGDDDQSQPITWRTAPEICELNPGEPDWLAYSLLVPGAITQLSGQIKLAGKTTFSLALCKAVVDGADFLGSPTTQTPVVYLTEQAHGLLAQQLTYARLGSTDFVSLSYDEHHLLSWADFVDAAVEKCREIGSKLLVIDTIGPFSGLQGEAENQQGAARETIRQLIKAKSAGIAVLVVRHERKSSGDIATGAVGAAGWGGAADILVSLRRQQNAPKSQRLLETMGRFPGHNVSWLIELDELRGTYKQLGDVAETTAKNLKDAIEDLLPEHGEPGLTSQEIVDALKNQGMNFQLGTIKNNVSALKKEERADSNGAGKSGDPFRYTQPDPDHE